jgi:hypothetical protein
MSGKLVTEVQGVVGKRYRSDTLLNIASWVVDTQRSLRKQARNSDLHPEAQLRLMEVCGTFLLNDFSLLIGEPGKKWPGRRESLEFLLNLWYHPDHFSWLHRKFGNCLTIISDRARSVRELAEEASKRHRVDEARALWKGLDLLYKVQRDLVATGLLSELANTSRIAKISNTHLERLAPVLRDQFAIIRRIADSMSTQTTRTRSAVRILGEIRGMSFFEGPRAQQDSLIADTNDALVAHLLRPVSRHERGLYAELAQDLPGLAQRVQKLLTIYLDARNDSDASPEEVRHLWAALKGAEITLSSTIGTRFLIELPL